MVCERARLSLTYFADLLEYPRQATPATATLCAAVLATELPAAAGLIRAFHDTAVRLPSGRIEELYTGTFDLDPVCYPYVGYHVFGETYKRSVFLLMLRERYRASGLPVEGGELADHVSALLRYLAVTEDPDEAAVILHEAMLPALQRMTGRAESAGHQHEASPPVEVGATGERRPYRDLLEALRLVLLALAGLDEDAEIELAEPARRSLEH